MKNKPKKAFLFQKTDNFHLRMKQILFLTYLLITSTASIYAQSRIITGTVTDVDKEPLPGVNVRISASSTRGTVADINGVYSIVAETGEVLEFSYVGMKSQFITIGVINTIDVIMDNDAKMLAETVVIGYGTAKKRDLTGSIVSIKAEDIANMPSTNAIAAIQGKVAGVQIINSGKPGQDSEIRIRGTNSINGYKPLFVVDGLFNDNISYLNPADIESMEILKDPSSLAIFGVRGANGVIIVTTKKAKEGQTVVNINTSFGSRYLVDKIKMTNADQFKMLYNEQLRNEDETSSGYDFSRWTGDTDWQKAIYRTGFITNNNISVTTATDKNKFYIGVGYSSEDGILKHESYDKITVNINNEINILKGFKIGFLFNGTKSTPIDETTDAYTVGIPHALFASPVATIKDANSGLYSMLPSFQNSQVVNPMFVIDLEKNTQKIEEYRGAGNIYADATFLKNFNFKVTYSLDYRTLDKRKYKPIKTVYDPYAGDDGTGAAIVLSDNGGKTRVDQSKLNETKVQSDYLLTYTNKFNEHSISATAGFTTFYNKLSSLDAGRGQGSSTIDIPNDPAKWYVSIGDPNTASNESLQWERSTVSMLLRTLYSYKNKYLFNGSFRRDGSSAFFYTGNEWQNFYSLGTGWIVTEEDFMKEVKFLDHLKVKGSWGLLGNQNMNLIYPAEPILKNEYSAIFGKPSLGIPGWLPAYTPDSNLKWEKIYAWEAGLEAHFLKNRLSFEGVYYKKNTKDLMALVPGGLGTLPGLRNLGELQNKGFELSLGWSDDIGKDFRYAVSANLTTIDNKVISLYQNGSSIIDGDNSVAYTTAGYPIGYFYGYKVDGIYQNQADIDNSPENKVGDVRPGDLKFKDIDGDNMITTADRTMIGNPTPDFTYGFSVNLGYKRFDLSVDMMGVSGNQIYRTWDNYDWSIFNYMEEKVGRWHGEGTSNTIPILDQGRAINKENSDYFIENGSFFRIRNIQLGYSFNLNLLKKIRLSALKVYINVQNPKTWKNNTGYTPELGGTATAFGIDNQPYPMPSSYTMGLNITF